MSAAPRPRFTFVITVRNRRHLADFIASVDAQSFTEGDLEVIAVDAGEGKGSAELLSAWQARRPDVVSVLTGHHAGPGGARNAGLARANGEWISFPDPDDRLAEGYLAGIAAFLDDHPDVDVVSAQRQLWNSETDLVQDRHPLRTVHMRRRVIDLDLDMVAVVGDPSSSFFRVEALRAHDVTFAEGPAVVDEDFTMAWRLLLRSGRTRVGVLNSARYEQRRNPAVAQQDVPGVGPRNPMLVWLRLLLALLDEARATGAVPIWLQHQVVYGLWLCFAQTDSRPRRGSPIEPADQMEFHGLVREVLERIDAATVVPFAIEPVGRRARYVLLHGYSDRPWHETSTWLSRLDPERRLVKASYFYTGPVPTEQILADEATIKPIHVKSLEYSFRGQVLLRRRIMWLPATHDLQIRLDGEATDLLFERPDFPRRTVSPSSIRHQLAADSPRLRHLARSILPPAVPSHADRLVRRLARSAPVRRRYADAWVLMDRVHDAGDNAESLFRHLRKHEPGVNAWFVLEKGSRDWRRLVAEGYGDRLVAHGSRRWLWLMLNCKHLLSSHADLAVTEPGRVLELVNPRWHFTFLQHGVIMFDLSTWLNAKTFDLMLTSTEAEFASIAGDGSYEATTREVALTELPRFDRLLRLADGIPGEERDLILVAPTWRRWLVPPLVPGSQRRRLDLSALESEFFTTWKAFLADPRLEDLATKHGLTIGFLPHPNLQPLLSHLDLPRHVEPLTYADNDVQTLLARARVMVTDYTSIAFDASYARRPVVYFQFDADRMLHGSHVGSRGYFDFEQDGFGPVAHRLPDAVARVVEAVEEGPGPAPKYLERGTAAFTFRDGQCCRRVVSAVKAITVSQDQGPAVATPVAPPRHEEADR